MKKIIFFLMFSLNMIVSYGQLPYKFVWEDPYDNEPSKAIELSNGYMLVSYTSKFNNQFITQNFLTLDKSGNLVDMAEIECPGTNYYISELIQLNDSSILGVGKIEYVDNLAEISIINLTPTLDVRWNKRYLIDYLFVHFLSACENRKGNITIAASVAQQSEVYPAYCMFMEVSRQGDLLKINYPVSLSNTNWLFDVVQDKSTSNYLVPAMGLGKYVNQSSRGQLITLDTSFQIKQVDSIVHNVYNCSTIMQDTDSTFLLTGNRSVVPPTGTDISVVRFDRKNHLIRNIDIGKPGQIADYGGLRQSMDFRYKSSIYVAGTSNMDVYTTFSWSSSWYVVSSFDSLLQPKWTKFYGGDAYYRLHGVTATNDKGCVLCGTRYDYRTQNEKRDLFILKITEQGLVTGLNNENTVIAHDVISYPNPGTDVLHIQAGPQLTGANFTLYNAAGIAVENIRIAGFTTDLNTSLLAAGNYIWKVIYNNKTIETGKWIKQ